MNLFLLVLAGLMAVAVVACGGGATEIYVGKSVSGTITALDANEEGWSSQPYVITVREGVEYFIQLASTNGTIVAVWSADADDYIIEVNSGVTARTVTYTFSESGPQELFLRSPDSAVPSSFTLKVWAPTGS